MATLRGSEPAPTAARACLPGLAEHFNKQIGRAVGDFGMLRETGHGVDEHGKLHAALDAVEIAAARRFGLRDAH